MYYNNKINLKKIKNNMWFKQYLNVLLLPVYTTIISAALYIHKQCIIDKIVVMTCKNAKIAVI